MLGSIRRHIPWNWAAIGKHPAAMDYIRIGGTSPLIEAVGDWAAKGYQHLRPNKDQPQAFHSWRFWLQAGKKGDLVIGLGRDSSDRIGRPFPLFLLGHGTMKGWEKKWADLPLLLGKTWQRMESIAARRFEALPAMEEVLTAIGAPETGSEASMPHQESADGSDEDMARLQDQMIRDGIGHVPLNHAVNDDSETSVLQCHRNLAAVCAQIPMGVFIGGTPQQTYLATIVHPLGKNDFNHLWSL